MFDIGTGELIALAVLAMIVLGPEKLPRYAAEAARFLRRMRAMASSAQEEVRRELGPEFDDLRISDLNPRAMVRRHLLEPIELDSLDGDEKPAARRGPGDRPRAKDGGRPTGPPDPPRYDPDAT